MHTQGGRNAPTGGVEAPCYDARFAMLRAALIGFGSSGKSTLFQLMTSARETARPAHGKGEAVIGISKVPDTRLDRLTTMYNPRKRVPATVEFSDLAPVGTAERRAGARRCGGVQECGRACSRAAGFRRSGRSPPLGVGRCGARCSGDGRRADPRRPRRGRAPAGAAGEET